MRLVLAAESKTARSAIRVALEEFLDDSLKIFEANDGLVALQIVADLKGAVDLILAEWKMPRMNGMSLLKQLKAMSLPHKIPVIMIASERDKEQFAEALRWGARDVILRPFTKDTLKEKVTAVRERFSSDTAILLHNIADHRRRAEGKGWPATLPELAPELGLPGLSGNLDTLPIPDLIQILNACHKTGHLRLVRGPEEAGIYFSEGEARHAWTRDLEGEPAFFRIISWKEAIFSFDSGLKPEQPTITQRTMTLLFEGLRQLDERGIEYPKAPPP